MIFISSLTTSIFISAINSDFEAAKASLKEKSLKFAEENSELIYSGMDNSTREQLNSLEKSSPQERKKMLSEQCINKDIKTSPFCDPRFIEGTLTLDKVMKENLASQIEESQLQAFSMMNEKLSSYSKYPLALIAVIAAVISIALYSAAKGALPGMQAFAGNTAWLSFLSALSFKFMPDLMNKLLGIAQKNAAEQAVLVSFAKDAMLAWLGPAFSQAFILTMIIAAVSFLAWFVLRIAGKKSAQ